MAIKGLGVSISQSIEEENQKESFCDIFDFVKRLYPRGLRKRNAEGLLKAGAFSSFDMPSSQILQDLDSIIDNAGREIEENVSGQLNLFGNSQPQTAKNEFFRAEFDEKQLSKMEKEALGFNIKRNPLGRYRDVILKRATPIEDIFDEFEGESDLRGNKTVTVGCVVENIKEIVTKKGDKMAQLTLEGLTGSIEAVCFPRQYKEAKQLLNSEMVLLVSGTLDTSREEYPKILINKVESVENLKESKNFGLYLKAYSDDDSVFLKALQLVKNFKGSDSLFVYFSKDKRLTKYNDSFNVTITEELLQQLKQILGDRNVAVKKEEE